jgi:3-oxoadipate enol-lactonase
MAEKDGISAIAEASIRRWFTPGYLERETSSETVDRVRRFITETTVQGYLACCVAIRDMDFRRGLAKIATPTLVIVGEKDPATLPEYGEFIAQGIRGAQSVVIPDAAHLSNIEQADIFTRTVSDFIGK